MKDKNQMEELNFDQLIEDLDSWPISKFSSDRSNFSFELTNVVYDNLLNKHQDSLLELIEKTVYLENRRVKNKPWKVDPSDDKIYWSKIQDALKNKSGNEHIEFHKHLLKKIITRYTEEILGNFVPKTFLFARNFLYRFFNLIYNKSFLFTSLKANRLSKKLKISGYVAETRDLFEKGTVVLVPTHYSNIDSILIGFCIDHMTGLPAFSYGAGLNLFDYEIPAFYMNRLGAYKIDRRKNNPVYRSTLLEMSSLSLQKGVNSLFFPGGGRSRSGGLETKLKKGLLSSLIDSQRELIKNQSNKKIIVVPVTFGYHFVLEAKSLIEDYLKAEGRSKYIRTELKKERHIFSFLKKLWTKESEVYVRFGKPMDVLGFPINENGKSIDVNNEPIDLKGFFLDNGTVSKNAQRESIYTKKLADKIIESYRVNNIVLSTHLVAYIAFELLQEKYPEMDVYTLVNTPLEKFRISKELFEERLIMYRTTLLKMESNNELKLEPVFHLTEDLLLRKGMQYIGIYHKDSPIYFDQKSQYYMSKDFKILFYYFNKLNSYELKIESK